MPLHLHSHPQDPFTFVATSQDAFLTATKNYGAEHGVIWDRSADEFSSLRQEYSDLFNNVSGIRKKVESFFAQQSTPQRRYKNQIVGKIKNDGTICYSSTYNDNLTTQFDELLLDLPHLKDDIEYGVRRIVQNPKKSRTGATIWLLSDHPHITKQDELQYKSPHLDAGDTFYIQCGGARLHIVKYDQDDYRPENHYAANNGDVIYMRGKNYPPFKTTLSNLLSGCPHHNYRPMKHFGNLEHIATQGRIAFTIF